jgi:hypothetical protein
MSTELSTEALAAGTPSLPSDVLLRLCLPKRHSEEMPCCEMSKIHLMSHTRIPADLIKNVWLHKGRTRLYGSSSEAHVARPPSGCKGLD